MPQLSTSNTCDLPARESPVAQMSFEHNTLDMEPATFSDKLVKKAFIVTKELLKDIAIPYNLLRNFACIFKVIFLKSRNYY